MLSATFSRLTTRRRVPTPYRSFIAPARLGLAAALFAIASGCTASGTSELQDGAADLQDVLVDLLLAEIPTEVPESVEQCLRDAVVKLPEDDVALAVEQEVALAVGEQKAADTAAANYGGLIIGDSPFVRDALGCVNTDLFLDEIAQQLAAGQPSIDGPCLYAAISAVESNAHRSSFSLDEFEDCLRPEIAGGANAATGGRPGIDLYSMFPFLFPGVFNCLLYDVQGAEVATVPALPVPCEGPKVLHVVGGLPALEAESLVKSKDEWREICNENLEVALGAPVDPFGIWQSFTISPTGPANFTELLDPSILICGVTSKNRDPETDIWWGKFDPQQWITLEPGDCLVVDDDGAIGLNQPVFCDQPHAAQVTRIMDLSKFSNRAAASMAYQSSCSAEPGAVLTDRARVTFMEIKATSWEVGRREWPCLARRILEPVNGTDALIISGP